MYLHIGSEIEVPLKNIISILDIEKIKCKTTNEFYKNIYKIVNISNDEPKTVILLEYNKRKKIYKIFLSPISTFTLQKRLNDTLMYLNKKNFK